jgi:hypothetical protein
MEAPATRYRGVSDPKPSQSQTDRAFAGSETYLNSFLNSLKRRRQAASLFALARLPTARKHCQIRELPKQGS